MNKLLIALFFVCAMTDVVVGATPGETESHAWFSASAASGSSAVSGGSFSPSDKPDVEGSKYVIASDLESPVTFATENEPAAQDYATVTFALDTTVVPTLETLTDKKVAFAVSLDGDERAYYAWFGSSWTKLSGTPKADGVSYTLVVTFDNREGNKVQFKVDDEVLEDENNNEWFNYGNTPITNTMSIDLVGNGTLTSFTGLQIEIKTEIVAPTDCGPITINEAEMKHFRDLAKAKGVSVDDFLSSSAKSNIDDFATDGISVGAAYALGMVKNGVAVDGGVLKAMAVAQSTDTENLTLALNVEPPEETGAQISHQVFKNGGATAISTTLSIPKSELGEGLTKFTVKAIITKPAN